MSKIILVFYKLPSLFVHEFKFNLNLISGWNPWTEWGSCSATCGAGIQVKILKVFYLENIGSFLTYL